MYLFKFIITLILFICGSFLTTLFPIWPLKKILSHPSSFLIHYKVQKEFNKLIIYSNLEEDIMLKARLLNNNNHDNAANLNTEYRSTCIVKDSICPLDHWSILDGHRMEEGYYRLELSIEKAKIVFPKINFRSRSTYLFWEEIRESYQTYTELLKDGLKQIEKVRVCPSQWNHFDSFQRIIFTIQELFLDRGEKIGQMERFYSTQLLKDGNNLKTLLTDLNIQFYKKNCSIQNIQTLKRKLIQLKLYFFNKMDDILNKLEVISML